MVILFGLFFGGVFGLLCTYDILIYDDVRISIGNVLSQHPRPPCLPSLILSGRRLDIKVSLGMGSLHDDVIKLHKCFHKKCCERYTLRKQKREILKFGTVHGRNPANQLIYIRGGAGFLPTASRISAPSKQ